MSVRLYVKLPKAQLEKEGVEKMFTDFEDSFTTKIIRERKKKECRGFGFVTVSTDEEAEKFISKYNNQPFVYNGETFKDEDGQDFNLVIEKALPRTKKDDESSNTEEENESNNEGTKADSSNNKPRPKKNNKVRKGGKAKGRSVPVSESIQPDPRWADELSKLKEMFTAQANN